MRKILPIFLLLLSAAVAMANTITYVLPSGATEMGGNPVSAQATFTTGAGTLTITLQNTLSDPLTVAQNISDLFFVLSSGQTSGTLSSSSGMERKVAADGTYTDGSMVSTGWALGPSGSGFLLSVLGTKEAPAHTIIGNPDASNIYGSANNSIAGNKPHNPFLAGPVTFVLDIAGVTVDTSITSVTFSFGTSEGDNVPGIPTPEPASLLLLGSGLLAVAGTVRRKMF